MSEVGNFIDGRGLLTKSPFRSGYFLVPFAMGILSAAMVIYTLARHQHTLTFNFAIFFGTFVGLHSIYQLWRALKYYSELRALYAERAEEQEGTPLDKAVRIAAGGIASILFFHFGMVLWCLLLILVLLRQIDGIRW